jgi:hypothetical protein
MKMSLKSAITVSADHKAKCWKQGLMSLVLNKLSDLLCKGNLTILRRILCLDLAKGNPKLIYK